MKVFVFGYDRFETMSTALMLAAENIPHTVLCHSEEAREKFIAAGTATAESLVATGQPRGLAYNRNVALDMMDDDEWALFLVDDLKSVTTVERYFGRTDQRLGISMDNQKQFRSAMNVACSMAAFLDVAHETAAVCEALGARLGGFCGIANPVFRDAKWRFNVLADGRAYVIQRSALRFETQAHCIDDYALTAQNIDRFGIVAVNQWVLADCRRYTQGGYGSVDERLPEKLSAVRFLAERFPHLLHIADKKNQPSGSHLRFRRTLSNAQIAALAESAHAVTQILRNVATA